MISIHIFIDFALFNLICSSKLIAPQNMNFLTLFTHVSYQTPDLLSSVEHKIIILKKYCILIALERKKRDFICLEILHLHLMV